MFSGSIVALVTPFNSDGEVDFDSLKKLVEHHIAAGTDGIVAVGTTGESATLTIEEHVKVVTKVVEFAEGRIPVIAGTGANATHESVTFSRLLNGSGIVGCLSVTPYYNKPNQEGIFQHFKAVNDAVDIPIVVYNIPGRSVIDITNATMARLSTLPNVIGCKDATGDVTRVTSLKDLCGDDFIQLSGDDPSSLGHSVHGGRGAISVGSNVAPAQCAAVHNACLAGDYAAAKQIHESLDGLHKDLFLDPSPSPAKFALSLLGKMGTDVRLPITPCVPSTETAVKSAMRRAGVDF